MINKRGGKSVNNEGFKVVKSSSQKKKNAKEKKKLKTQTQNNSNSNVKPKYKYNPNNFPNLPKPATRASTKPKPATRASTKPKPTTRASTKPKPATRASNNSWGTTIPNTSNSSWGNMPNASNSSWGNMPDYTSNVLRQAKEKGWLNDANTENGTPPKRKSKSKTSNSTSTKTKRKTAKPTKTAKPKPKPKMKAPPKPAFYGLTQPQFKKELEKIGFKYKEVSNAEYSNNTNLVFVGKKGYLLFSPSNNNKVKHLEKNNKNNPYKIAINDYKSVNNGKKRKYTTKGSFLLALKKKYKAVSNARTARKNARKKALNKGKKNAQKKKI